MPEMTVYKVAFWTKRETTEIKIIMTDRDRGRELL